MIKSAYIHIPFCKDICTYCDFCKYYYNEQLVDNYLLALDLEIKNRYRGDILNTIYIGGGTPSCLSFNQIRKLLDITKRFKFKDVEFTFECNIESIDEEKAKLLKSYGVNRLSVGVQTFNSKYLKWLNRKHNKTMVFKKINMLKKYFDNINIDLIYAIPQQTLTDLKRDIDMFLKLDIMHISTYSLIIEEHTILGNWGVINIDDELDAKMYKLIMERLQGYEHYEISNFGKKKSLHNLNYWNNDEYYGFGMGASGYEDNVRYTNTRSINHYLKGNYRYEKHLLSFNETVENAFILELRKIKGINKHTFFDKYHFDIMKVQPVLNLIADGRLVDDGQNIFIDQEYLYTSNDILVEFLGVDYEKYI